MEDMDYSDTITDAFYPNFSTYTAKAIKHAQSAVVTRLQINDSGEQLRMSKVTAHSGDQLASPMFLSYLSQTDLAHLLLHRPTTTATLPESFASRSTQAATFAKSKNSLNGSPLSRH